jgi:GAF domain-containing protein
MPEPDDILSRLAAIAARHDDRAGRGKEAAESIRLACNYHWVGLYDVTASEIRALAWTGVKPPAFPIFPRTLGLNGAAVSAGWPVVINDVRSDRRYLTTFGTTLAEAVVPVRVGKTIVGTIDVESDQINAFTADDERFLQRCAEALVPLWSSRAAE